MLYILDDTHNPLIVSDLAVWGAWMQDINNLRIGLDELESGEKVSTVFLGIEHNLPRDDGSPILFETLICSGPYDNYMVRYSTWEQAEKGHKVIVQARLDGDAPNLD